MAFSSRDLQARANKLQEEDKARKERERQRLEKERLIKERAAQREAEREAERARRRQEELEAERRAEERRSQLTESNRGIWLQAELQALPLDEDALVAKGIKRAKDKVRRCVLVN